MPSVDNVDDKEDEGVVTLEAAKLLKNKDCGVPGENGDDVVAGDRTASDSCFLSLSSVKAGEPRLPLGGWFGEMAERASWMSQRLSAGDS